MAVTETVGTIKVLAAIERFSGKFSLTQLEQACPGVSRDIIRRVLSEQKGKTVECLGRGPGAKRIKKG